MRVPIEWLSDYCDPGIGSEALTERLSMTGTEVERIDRFGVPTADGFVVGRVESAEPHPDADRLRVCSVDVGEGSPRTIVCGAPNVAAGQLVAVALPGAVMPAGQELSPATLRGVVSDGMICSEAELELSGESEGIAVLEARDGVEPGVPLADLIPIGTDVLELEITPNRPDCLGVYGVAREVHAITGASLADEPWASDAEASGDDAVGDFASVTVEDPDLCPRFTARVFCDVTVAPSPPWLKARLAAAGQRPINNVVDITNYVMLLTGQPLHAFDLDKVPGGALIVRRARTGERMTTLDGEERIFDEDAMLVCDRERPTGIAGIMGGQVSEVSEQTTRVLLEVATWDGPNILSTSSKLALRSEASARFEKGLHPELPMRAQRVASRLMVELCGARLVPGTIDVAAPAPALAEVELRLERISGLLGMEIGREAVIEYLDRLGFEVTEADDGSLRVTVPADRTADVTREVDLIEEVARIHGLDELPATLPATRARVGGLAADQSIRRSVANALAVRGFDEIVSWSFVGEVSLERLEATAGAAADAGGRVRIANPLSGEHAVMRTTLLAGLLDAAHLNVARGARAVALFESGRVYLPVSAVDGSAETGVLGSPPPAIEPHRVGAISTGIETQLWSGDAGKAPPFFRLKGVLEAMAGDLGLGLAFEPAARPFLHPGKSAEVLLGDASIGWLGELSPVVAEAWGLPVAVAFEVDLAPLVSAALAEVPQYEDVPSFPAVYEDIAVVVPADVPGEAVRSQVLGAGGELLASAVPFDLYQGDQLADDRKSLALRLEFRAPDRTLTDSEVAERREAIKTALGAIGGSLRE